MEFLKVLIKVRCCSGTWNAVTLVIDLVACTQFSTIYFIPLPYILSDNLKTNLNS